MTNRLLSTGNMA